MSPLAYSVRVLRKAFTPSPQETRPEGWEEWPAASGTLHRSDASQDQADSDTLLGVYRHQVPSAGLPPLIEPQAVDRPTSRQDRVSAIVVAVIIAKAGTWPSASCRSTGGIRLLVVSEQGVGGSYDFSFTD